MKNILVALLLLAGIALAAYGVHTYQESTAELNILGLELSARDKGGQQSAYMYMGLGALGIIAGLLLWRKR